MAHKYEHVSTGGGFKVKNGATTTTVINQDGSINVALGVTTVDLTTTGHTVLGNAVTDT